MSEQAEAKTVGITSCIYGSGSTEPLFHVGAGVPVGEALAQASDLLSLAKALTEDPADRHAWAARYLTALGKAVIDDVVKVVTLAAAPRP